MSILAGRVDFVIGVDTHKDTHTAAVVDGLGGLHDQTTMVTDAAGYDAMVRWARAAAPGRRIWAIEGTGSFGAALTTHLLAAEEWVCEVDRPKRPARKGGAKSDAIDAVRAAREALGAEYLGQPRRRGSREAMRVLQVTRKQAVEIEARAVRHLKNLVINAPDALRARLRALSGAMLVATCAKLHQATSQSLEWNATASALRSTARRAQTAAREAADLEKQLAALVCEEHPQLVAEMGVGPVIAARLSCAWSHRGRMRSEGAFARLAGTAPIPASSGQVVRHRLNPGGDRQLNSALHMVLVTRLGYDARTKAYVARRRAEGKSDREIYRCLKRYLSRHVFRVMESDWTNKFSALDKP
jgi:transposase